MISTVVANIVKFTQTETSDSSNGEGKAQAPNFVLSEFLADCVKVSNSTRPDVRPPDYPSFKTEIQRDYPSIPRVTDRANTVLPDALEGIGQTPLFRLSKIMKRHGIKANLFGKAEFMSIGGSVKDRIGRRIIEIAEEQTDIKPGDIVVEATSGNTGIGMALACAVKGYHMVVVMPEKMSAEKENTLHALGAKVIRTRTSANWNDADSIFSVAYRLVDEINSRADQTGIHAFNFDQYKHEGNLLAHYQETATEILAQVPDGRIDAFVAPAGTGGTISGAAYRLKEERPHCKIVAVDPEGSVLHKTVDQGWNVGDFQRYEVEGIGHDFHPPVFLPEIIDEWEIVNDEVAFAAARELIAEEGLPCGGSCGSAVIAAIKVAKAMPEDSNIVVILPDSIRNYLTKFASDNWMVTHGFAKPSILETQTDSEVPVKDIPEFRSVPLASLPVFSCTSTVASVFAAVKNAAVSHFLVQDNTKLCGILAKDDLVRFAFTGNATTKTLGEIAHPATLAVIPRCSSLKLLNAAMLAADAAGRSKNAPIIIASSDLPEGLSENMRQSRDWLIEQVAQGNKSAMEQSYLVTRDIAAAVVMRRS